MLNRKMSNYIYYGVLFAIFAIVILIRVITIGNMNTKIATLKASNVSLQAQIDALEETVEANKDVQTDELYELYHIIPNVYSATALTYKTVSILENLGIDEQDDFQRTVFVNQSKTFDDESMFAGVANDFYVVEVQVYFTTMDAELINEFIDALYNQDQLFIVDYLNYSVPTGENYIGVFVNFLAIYDVEIEEAS